MTRAKHTPGPWGLRKCNCRDSCRAYYVTGPGYPPTEADARLIAAAPDMLEALKKANTCRKSMNGDVVELIDKAIAKAKGES